MKGIILVVAFLVLVFSIGMCGKSHAKTPCLSKPGVGYHAYRKVDNKKCWYKGKRVLRKHELYWKTTNRNEEVRKAKAQIAQKEKVVEHVVVGRTVHHEGYRFQQGRDSTAVGQIPFIFATLLISNDVPVWLDRVTHTTTWPEVKHKWNDLLVACLLVIVSLVLAFAVWKMV